MRHGRRRPKARPTWFPRGCTCPRPFHNMRASCESDLVREYPIPTVCKWLGNTVAIATRHYVDVSDEDVRRAAGLSREAVQNPVQRPLAPPCSGSQQETPNPGLA